MFKKVYSDVTSFHSALHTSSRVDNNGDEEEVVVGTKEKKLNLLSIVNISRIIDIICDNIREIT